MMSSMKTISLAVSEDEYEEYRREASRQDRPIAQLIRDAMGYYRRAVMAARPRLESLPVLVGHTPTGPLPSRAELYDEVFDPS
jgi:hypothetical protein